MTDNTQPEALRLATASNAMADEGEMIHLLSWHEIRNLLRANAAELRRQHARIAELQARIKTMAEEHADELMVALSDAEIDRIVPALEPVSEDFPAEWAVWKDRERIREELRASHGQAPAQAAPQPSPTPQADSQPAPQGETNAQLDTDSNPPTPGQQRDVAGPVALGQPVGNGSDQAAGHTGAQGDKLLTVAERNIRSFLRSATFKSESDREAALNCVDVLWAAARAPADSVTAPASGAVAGPDVKYALTHADIASNLLVRAHEQAPETWRGWYDDALVHIDIARKALAADPTPPAKAADSVLEDAARWQELREQHESDEALCCVFAPNDMRECLVPVGSLPGELDAFMDTERAARKQGANHD